MSENVTQVRTSEGKGDKKISRTTEVEQIENGFIITERKEYKNKDGWQYESKKYYSEKNPLEIKKDAPSIIKKNLPGV